MGDEVEDNDGFVKEVDKEEGEGDEYGWEVGLARG